MKIYTRANHRTVLTQWPAADRTFRCVAYGAGFSWELLMLCTQARDCPPEQSEGTQNCEQRFFTTFKMNKSVGGIILCSVILTVGKDLKTAAKYL